MYFPCFTPCKTRSYKQTHTHARTSARTHAHTCARARAHTHTHTHTHTVVQTYISFRQLTRMNIAKTEHQDHLLGREPILSSCFGDSTVANMGWGTRWFSKSLDVEELALYRFFNVREHDGNMGQTARGSRELGNRTAGKHIWTRCVIRTPKQVPQFAYRSVHNN